MTVRRYGLLLAVGALMGCTGDERGALAPAPAAAATTPAPRGRALLRQVAGAVKVKRAAGDDWVGASERMELYENDKVRAGAGSSAVVEFTNGSHVTLTEDTLISIAETRPRPGSDRTDLTVLKGRIDAELDDGDKKSLSVTTPSATVRAGREIVFQ